MPNTGNLTHGRSLQFEVKFLNTAALVEAVKEIAQSFDRQVRNESMYEAATFFEERARTYIREGKQASKVPDTNPRSHHLEDKIKVVWAERDKVVVSVGDGVPYARMSNAMPGSPVTYTSPRWMKFIWYKEGGYEGGRKTWAKTVSRPGTGYFTRAVDDLRRDRRRGINAIVQKWIAYFAAQGENIDPKGGGRRRGPNKNARERRDARLR